MSAKIADLIKSALSVDVRYIVLDAELVYPWTRDKFPWAVYDANKDNMICLCRNQADAANVCSALNFLEHEISKVM